MTVELPRRELDLSSATFEALPSRLGLRKLNSARPGVGGRYTTVSLERNAQIEQAFFLQCVSPKVALQ